MNELLTLTTGMPPETYTTHTTPILMWYGLFVVKKVVKENNLCRSEFAYCMTPNNTTTTYKKIPIIRHFQASHRHKFIRQKYDTFQRKRDKIVQKYRLKTHLARENTI